MQFLSKLVKGRMCFIKNDFWKIVCYHLYKNK